MKQPKVVIVILNFNGLSFLKANIDSVLSQHYNNFSILIVDNSSSDGSISFIDELARNNPGKVSSLKLNENLGFTGGNNKGIEEVLKDSSVEFIVLLNNDVRPEKTWLQNLIEGFDSEEIGITTSNIFLYYPYQKIILSSENNSILEKIKINGLDYHALNFPEGFSQKGTLLNLPYELKANTKNFLALPFEDDSGRVLEIDYTGYKLKIDWGGSKKEINSSGKVQIELDGQYIHQNAGSEFLDSSMIFEDRLIFDFEKKISDANVDAACGAAMAVRTELLKKYGAFDPRFFMYFEDSELSFRYAKEGFSTKFVSKARAYHYFWGTSGAKVTKIQTFYGTRNRLLFIKKHFGFKKFVYFWLRTFARTFIWGLKFFTFNSKAEMYFTSYFKALFSSLIK